MAIVEFQNNQAPYINAENLNKIQEANIYSTSETKIGVWMGSDLYRKVIDYLPTEAIGASGATTNINIAHGISNLAQVKDVQCRTADGYIFPVMGSAGGTTITSATGITNVDATNIVFRIINDAWQPRHFYFIIEYTKS